MTLYRLTIQQDNNAQSPRTNDNLGHMLQTKNRRSQHYTLSDDGTTQDREALASWWASQDKRGLLYTLQRNESDGCLTVGVQRYNFNNTEDVLPDGFYYASYDALRAAYGHKVVSAKDRIKACRVLHNEIEDYNSWVSGNVYRYDLATGTPYRLPSGRAATEWQDDDVYGALSSNAYGLAIIRNSGMMESLPSDVSAALDEGRYDVTRTENRDIYTLETGGIHVAC